MIASVRAAGRRLPDCRMPFCASTPIMLMADALLTPSGRAVPGLLFRHPLMAGDAQRPDVGHRALAAPFHDRHDVVGIPVGATAKEPPVALPELSPFSPLLLGVCALDPVPFRAEGHAERGGIDAADGANASITAKDALPHQRRAVSARPVIDAALAAESTAALGNLGAAVPTRRTNVWSPRKLLSLNPSGLGADPGGTHGGSIRISSGRWVPGGGVVAGCCDLRIVSPQTEHNGQPITPLTPMYGTGTFRCAAVLADDAVAMAAD